MGSLDSLLSWGEHHLIGCCESSHISLGTVLVQYLVTLHHHHKVVRCFLLLL